MIRYWLEKKFKAFEETTGESADYIREILQHTPKGLFLFFLFMPLTYFRGKLSKEAFHIARIYTIKHEDCGPCLQTVVTLAVLDGVDPGLIQLLLENEMSAFPNTLRVVADFTQAVLERKPNLDDTRAAVIQIFGERAVAELALAIASVRVYPVVKRAMGYARSCSLVQVSLPRV